ncbi:helix-turn-helix transcriptional regulator [Chakrabartyella piscis]|uniref:helix-turn-helix domain-containing protein n=1 Tax=Chakrabartyella piscis TaxID=2918914 RepID=UPI002958BD8B|nr:helix-turn-helix transcriptional regulator [Chakrabartyella piscis]
MKVNIQKLTVALANKCFSINDLAEQSNVSRISIGKLISGKVEPRTATVGKIAKALDCKVEDLVE